MVTQTRSSSGPHSRSRVRLVALVLIGVLLLALPLAAAPTTSPAPAEVEAYRHHVNVLASPRMQGRAAGLPGTAKAHAYLLAALRAAGVKPALGDSYQQGVPVPLGAEATKQMLAVGQGKKALALRAGEDFAAVGLSDSRAFAGPAVFVGYAIRNTRRKYDNFASLKPGALKGKVAVAWRYEPVDALGQSRWTGQKGKWSRASSLSAKAAMARRYGAEALLIVSPPATGDEPLLTARTTPSRTTGGLAVMHVTTAGLAHMLTAAGLDAADELARLQELADSAKPAATEIAGLTLSGEVKLKRLQGSMDNLIGVVPGRGNLAHEVVVVGAHWDHVGIGPWAIRGKVGQVHPGANDNASGTAGVLMLAGRFAARAGKDKRDRRTVLFALFAAEERGLLGSSFLAGHLKDLGFERKQVAAMVNLDMIGRPTKNQLLAWGVESGTGWASRIEQAAKGSGLAVLPSGGGYGPSDYASFYRHKIPVLCFTTGIFPDLHSPADTPDKIDSVTAMRIVGVIDRLVEDLAHTPQRVQYQPPKKGGRAFLGVQLDSSGGDEGVAIQQVVPGGPADKAGLQAGDVLTHWSRTRVPNLSALYALLGRAKPGQKVPLTVRRGKQTLQLSITLGSR